MGLSGLIVLLFNLYTLIVLVRVVFSWLPHRRYGSGVAQVGIIAYKLTEPLLAPIRRILWRYQGGMQVDFSPMVLLVVLMLIERLLVNLVGRVAP